MLMVAPSGSVKEVTRLLTRPRSSTVLSVTGSVIEDEEVLKAVIRAGDMARNQSIGRILPMDRRRIGRVTVA